MKSTRAVLGPPLSPVGRHLAVRGAIVCLSALLVALLSALTFSSSPASAASPPPDRVTFGIEPASASGPDGRPNFSFEMTPGAVLFGYAAVVNYSPIPLTLQVYATDAIETSGGGFGLLPPTATPTGVGAWVSLPAGTSTVQVPAESPTKPGEVVLPITVHVPVSATPGDHVGGLIASLRTVGTNKTGQTVVLNQRIGSRVFIQVAGPLTPSLTLTGLSASYSGTVNPGGKGKVSVHYVVSNTGNVDLAVHDQQVSVSGLVDDSHHVTLANIPLLLPGATVTENVAFTGVWPQFLLHPKASVVPVAEETVPATLATVSASTTLWAIPWTLVLIVLIVALIVIAVVRRRRRRSRTPKGRHSASRAGIQSNTMSEPKVPA
jgi:hypothetical protein